MKKAEAKILFIMCYYILLGTVVLTLFTYLEESGENPEVFQAIEKHFTCQSAGIQPGRDCGKPLRDSLSAYSALSAISTILSGLIPVVAMVFTLKCTYRCRSTCKKVQEKQ
jgi:VIT1/CCC1 family predicted Fe2+/Mn2+ transporter